MFPATKMPCTLHDEKRQKTLDNCEPTIHLEKRKFHLNNLVDLKLEREFLPVRCSENLSRMQPLFVVVLAKPSFAKPATPTSELGDGKSS
jgi:hypothetical protein